MNIEISQYRASIGSFNEKYKVIKSRKEKYNRNRNLSYKYKSTFKMGNSFKYILALFIFMVALCGRQKLRIFDTNAIYKSYLLAAHQSSSFQMYLEENGQKYIILRS